MEDDELAAIRAKRMAQLKGSSGGAPAGMTGLPPGMNIPGMTGGQGQGNQAEDAEKRKQMEEMRRTMLVQILDNDARERLARISIVKPDKSRAVEDLIIRMAQTGQLRSKVNEKQLIDMLEQINSSSKPETKVKVARRRDDDDDDDEDYGF
ncbi:hypothetical protein SmJEL517_g05223 [Synchytrium microbalum]|uniref:Programmed cell death protein 5 n=1 Tax=Synchytrium microbalum TaxID=1806994 RepID=A0A507BMM2_9FUNG|nr:uncharacterized protein SmJEL517_g05223 [Synchytrium microbalum]TPX31460.1 hypothetical protein SmJEL517_g05223 [Synchytrium microbalum]